MKVEYANCLTASEQGYLWSMYQSLSMNMCILKYFDQVVEDEEIKKLNSDLLAGCVSTQGELTTIMNHEGFPIPVAFSDQDVNLQAGKLFTEPLILYYHWFFSKGNLNYSSIALNTIAREDVFALFKRLNNEALERLDQARKLLLEKGLWIRSPYIPIPKEVQFVQKQSYLTKWLGEHRPLTGQEISMIFYNILTNEIGLTVMKGFIQVTDDEPFKSYLSRGKEIAAKHMNTLSEIFQKEEISTPGAWSVSTTSSKTAPFSTKLMISLVNFLNSQGIANYGVALTTAMRSDIYRTFITLMADVSRYTEDGANLLIEHGWFESPPQAPKLT
ncbi:DUF3231 family protein [Robertmurraya korlensis]|uniref:DUF3231 family protein n=1 Tax=Robertmurraya korlensis TaxID=519977 RepID=UPI000826A73C|nr:DUF3231 family protein [Robertmurraya korlensis]